MRRRQNADAPSPSSAADSSPTTEETAAPVVPATEASADVTPTAASDAAETPAPPRRRAAPRRAKTPPDAVPAASPEPIAQTTIAETPAVTEDAPEPKKPARRRSKAVAAPEPIAAPEAEPVLAQAEPISEPITPPLAPEETAAAEAEPVKPKRAPRRRTPKAVPETPALEVIAAEIAEPETAAVGEALPEPEPVEENTVAPAGEEAAPLPETIAADEGAAQANPTRSSRRRNARRNAAAQNNAPAADATTANAAAEVTAPPVVPDTNAAEGEGASASSRRRGRLRRNTPAATETAGAASETAPATSSAAEAAPPAGSRRVRGVPRRRETTAANASETAAEAVIAPRIPVPVVEPLPPPYQPLAAEVLARLPEVRVVSRRNRPQLTVNGEEKLPFWFFVNTQDEESLPAAVRQIRMAYEAGIRFFSLFAHLPWKTRTGERRYGPLDDVLQMMAENAPDALLIPRLIFSPPASWERANPNEMIRYEGHDELGDVSLASRAFWEGEADEALRAAVEYVAQSDHAHRIGGFYLEHGEWLQDKERGADVSDANTAGFRTWLRTRYKALVNLRAAWHDGSVTFENAEIPAQNAPATSQTLFWGERQQRWADFARYTSEVTSGVIVRLAQSVKEASGNRSAVAVSYGYSLEIMRANSGHNDLARVLASPHVDILTGPISYQGRLPGGSAPLPVPLDSVHLAGKLWISEDDTKTFLASGETPDSYNPKIAAPEGTWAAHSRNFGTALARGAGLSWMDLWGEGWLDDRYVWENIAHLNHIAARLAQLHQARQIPDAEAGPDVAVIVDERSFYDVPPQSEAFLAQLVANHRDVILRSGATVGFYLLSDLRKDNFPKTPRLLLFLNAFHLPDAMRAAVKKQQDDGKTLVWLFGPGCRDQAMNEAIEAVGMQLRLQPWGSKTGTTLLSNVRSPITESLRGQKIGDEVRTNPSYYVADPKATILGEYSSGLPSLAYRKHARYQSVFLGETGLTLPLLRGLYRLAGVPAYTVDDDSAVLGDGLLSLHSAPGGGTTVYLPDDLVLYDLLTSETVSSGGFGARLSMPPQGTRLLFAGTPGEIRALGGEPDAAPYGLNEDELPPLTPAFIFETDALAPLPPRADRTAYAATAEDADLMEAAFVQADLSPDDKTNEDDDEPLLLDVPASAAGAETAAAAEAKKKRRRRRRGPKRDTPLQEGEDATANADEEESDEEDESETSETREAAATGSETDTEPSLFDAAVTPTGDAEAASALVVPMPAASVPPGPVARLTLEELLPQSVLPEDAGELPPIPDELLPLDPGILSTSDEMAGSGSEGESAAPPVETETPVRRRRGRPRRTAPTDEPTGEA